MKRTNRVLSLLLVAAMVMTFLPVVSFAYEPGEPFSGALNFTEAANDRWSYSNTTEPGYNNIHSATSPDDTSIAREFPASAGKSGGYASTFEVKGTKPLKGGCFYYIKFPNIAAEDFYTGLTTISFWYKNIGMGNIKFGFFSESTGVYTTANLPSTGDVWTQFTVDTLSDPTYNFARSMYMRISNTDTVAVGGKLVISDLTYGGTRPGTLVVDPDTKRFEYDTSNAEADYSGLHYQPQNSTVSWAKTTNKYAFTDVYGNEFTDVGSATLDWSVAGGSGAHTGRAGLHFIVPSEWKNLSKMKYLSYIYRNKEGTVPKGFSFVLGTGASTSLFSKGVSWDTVTMDDWDGKWQEVNVPITDSTGNDFSLLQGMYLSLGPGSSGSIEIARVILSTDPIPKLELEGGSTPIPDWKQEFNFDGIGSKAFDSRWATPAGETPNISGGLSTDIEPGAPVGQKSLKFSYTKVDGVTGTQTVQDPSIYNWTKDVTAPIKYVGVYVKSLTNKDGEGNTLTTPMNNSITLAFSGGASGQSVALKTTQLDVWEYQVFELALSINGFGSLQATSSGAARKGTMLISRLILSSKPLPPPEKPAVEITGALLNDTESPGYAALLSGAKNTVEISVQNTGTADITDAAMVIAFYEKVDGVLSLAKIEIFANKTLTAGAEIDDIISGDITLPSGITGGVFKVFLWRFDGTNIENLIMSPAMLLVDDAT